MRFREMNGHKVPWYVHVDNCCNNPFCRLSSAKTTPWFRLVSFSRLADNEGTLTRNRVGKYCFRACSFNLRQNSQKLLWRRFGSAKRYLDLRYYMVSLLVKNAYMLNKPNICSIYLSNFKISIQYDFEISQLQIIMYFLMRIICKYGSEINFLTYTEL